MIKFKFVGKGEGVPGLPHEITGKQSEQWRKDFEGGKKQAEADLRKQIKAAGREPTPEDDVELEKILSRYLWHTLQAAVKNGSYEEVKGRKEAANG